MSYMNIDNLKISGKILSNTVEKRALIDSFLESMRRRERILRIISSRYEEEMMPTIEFRLNKLDAEERKKFYEIKHTLKKLQKR